jgi:hypothetical protein
VSRTTYCVCQHTVQQRSFLFLQFYVKCGSVTKCRRDFSRKFPGNTVPSTRGNYEFIKNVRSTGPLLDKKPVTNRRVIAEEKLNEIGATLTHTRRLTQETGVSKPSAATAKKLLTIRRHKATVLMLCNHVNRHPKATATQYTRMSTKLHSKFIRVDEITEMTLRTGNVSLLFTPVEKMASFRKFFLCGSHHRQLVLVITNQDNQDR